MVWVDSEYTEEFGVLATWLSMIVPWSVTYFTDAPLQSIVAFVRVSVFELQLRFPSTITFDGVPLEVANALAAEYSGIQLFGNFYATVPPAAAIRYNGPLALANWAWTLAAVVMLLAFGLSVSMYVRTDNTRERLPRPYHRIAGTLLGLASVLSLIATVGMYLERDVVGVPIPVGVVIVGGLAVALLRAETVDGRAASGAVSE
jgi:hypothetical protein